MAVVTTKVDPSVPYLDRSCSWTDSDFSAADVVDVENSLGRPASHLEIDAAADAAVTVRINSYHRDYALHPDAKRLGFSAPDLSSDGLRTWTDENAFTIVIGNGESTAQDIMVKNIEIVSLTAGSGVTITVR